MPGPRHVIVGGGTAAINAITTIRQLDSGQSELVLVANERPYSRMVLPYYLGGTISRSHVFTLTAPRLAELGVNTTYVGRRAVGLDTVSNTVTLDDGRTVEYDDLLIATGSSAVRAPVPGADGPGVHSFWTLDQAEGLMGAIGPGSAVTLVGAGFIAFTILNALLKRGVTLTIIEIAPTILPRMIDATGAALVADWLTEHGVTIRAGARLQAIEQVDGRRRLLLDGGEAIMADAVIMATGIRANLDWLAGSAVKINRGVVVDDHLRSSVANVYAAGDVAEGRDRVTGEPAVHAIEPTAMEHGRVVGANMAGRDIAYRGSLLMNIVDVLDLEIASFGAWDDASAESVVEVKEARRAYRRLNWQGDRLTGAIILGLSHDLWTTNDVGMLKGLVQSGQGVGAAWKEALRRNPWDIKRPYIATGHVARLLPETVLGEPSVPAGAVGVTA